MATKMFFVFILVALQCGLVPGLSILQSNTSNSPIPVTELLKELQREDLQTCGMHYAIMTVPSYYGGQLYELSVNLSLECFQTVRAAVLTIQNLTVCEAMYDTMRTELPAAALDLRKVKQLEEHPVELFCRRIKKLVENATLGAAFKAAKIEAAKFDFSQIRAPYSATLLTSDSALLRKYLEMLAAPELDRMEAASRFALQTHVSEKDSWRIHYFVLSCQAVARLPQYMDSIQSLYGKVLDELPELATKTENIEVIMARKLYQYIASDVNLKKELETQAAIVGKGASPEDLDFSKL